MNTKSLIAIIILVLVIFGAWFGISRWQRSRILSGDRDVLLIDKKNNSYSFLSSSESDDIESSAKIIGFVDEFTEQELAELVKDYNYSGSSIGPYTPTAPSVEVETPEESEKAGWEKLLATISTEQQTLCDAMPIADLAQFCVVNHIIFTAFTNQQSAEVICPDIFVEEYKAQCEKDLSSDGSSFADEDQNGLLDSFELYTGKAEQFRSQ